MAHQAQRIVYVTRNLNLLCLKFIMDFPFNEAFYFSLQQV